MQNKPKVSLPQKVNQIVPIGFGLVLLLAGIATVFSEITKNNLSESQKMLTHTYQVREQLRQLEKDLVDAETGQRGFILTGNQNYLEPYESGLKNYPPHAEALKKLVSDNPTQVQRVESIAPIAQQKFSELAETISLKKSGKEKEAIALVSANSGKKFLDEIRAKLTEMDREEQRLLEQRQKASEQFQQFTTAVSWGGWVFSAAIGISTAFYVARRIMQPITEAASVVVTSSSNIAATIAQQERTVIEQSASVNQTTTTIEEVGTSALQSAAQAEATAKEAKQALFLAEGGTKTVGLTIEGISDLKDQVIAIANQIVLLSEQTAQITTISHLVGELADKTNMLALNAGVEAARAGEQGKGFAVIAGEIRKLADQSRKSADQINAVVNQVQVAIGSTVMVTDEGTKKATEGIKLTQETGDVFISIADAVNKVFINSQQIFLSAKEQAVAVQQVVSAMNVLNLDAKETAVGITQVRDATTDLNKAAQDLKSLV